VTRSGRTAVVISALALTLATWAHLPLAAMGLPVARWETFVFDACDPFCHQNPARSFHLGEHVFPLCTRCTGMWLGITLGVALAMVVWRRRRWAMGLWLAVVATAVSGVDALREASGGASRPWIRAVFGFLLFLGVTFALSFDALAVLSRLGRWIRRPRWGTTSRRERSGAEARGLVIACAPMTESSPVVDVSAKTVTHAGTTFIMRPLSEDSFTALVDGVPVGRVVYTFGAANGVVEGEGVTEEVLTAVGEAWFAAIDG